MRLFHQVAKTVLSIAIGITVGTMLSWFLLAAGYHLGAMENKSRAVTEKDPIKIAKLTSCAMKNCLNIDMRNHTIPDGNMLI